MKICGSVLRPLRALGHLAGDIRVPRDVDLTEGHPFARQKLLGVMAIGAELSGVDFDRGHDEPLSSRLS